MNTNEHEFGRSADFRQVRFFKHRLFQQKATKGTEKRRASDHSAFFVPFVLFFSRSEAVFH